VFSVPLVVKIFFVPADTLYCSWQTAFDVAVSFPV
jgi:hypothetical protein